jgi:hypothetical protein
MSEIEKMYETCGIYPDCKARECGLDYCANSSGCGYAVYPDFTAEKQLEIVKQILFSTWWMNLKRLQFSEKFDEGLAQMINELWQDLTEEERKQIKNILESEVRE